MTAARHTGLSFTGEVVAELVPHVPLLGHCRAALIEGMRMAGTPPVTPEDRGGAAAHVLVVTRRAATARLAVAALHADAVPARLERWRTPRGITYAIMGAGDPVAPDAQERPCCDRARVRGAFLVAGAVNRPDAPPHAEIVAVSDAAAVRLSESLERIGVPSSTARRRGHGVVLLRSADAVGALLSSIGAQGGRLRFEEGRVVRELRAGVNRRLNSETANLARTVRAGLRQARAAERLQRDEQRWARTPPAVREAAVLRHRHPQETLGSLAARAGTSRSAMAGRLRRLVELARGR